jgi:hypothetical protein
MMFKVQKLSNVGSENPIVARTYAQGNEILQFFSVAEEQRHAAFEVLFELQRHLVKCGEIRDRLAKDIAAGVAETAAKGFQFQAGGRAVTLPSVPDLQSAAESFLQSAKPAIRETARLVEPFYGVKHDHRYQKFASWAQQQFGAEDSFARMLVDVEPWVKSVLEMRDAVDHPDDEPGKKLITRDFRIENQGSGYVLINPVWHLLGEGEGELLPQMDAIIEGILCLGENVLAALFDKLKGKFPLVIEAIPVEQRNPANPMRLRVSLGQASAAALKSSDQTGSNTVQ